MRKKIWILMMAVGLSLLFAGKEAKGQLKLVEFNAGPTFGFGGILGGMIDWGLKDISNLCPLGLKPSFQSNCHNIIKLETEQGKFVVADEGQPWKIFLRDYFWNGCYYIGYHASVIKKVGFPIGFDAEITYNHLKFRMCKPNEIENEDFIKGTLTPSLIMRIRLNDYLTGNDKVFAVDIKGSYDIAMHYNDKVIDDKNAVNNGWCLGGGVTRILPRYHLGLVIGYEMKCYKFYNSGYTYQNDRPFEGCKSVIGTFYFSFTKAIGRVK